MRPPELAPNHSHARDFTGCRQFLQETSPTALELRHQHPDQQIFAPPAAVASRDAHPGACVIFALQASPSLESGRPIRPRRAPLPPPPNHDRAICPSPDTPPRRREDALGVGGCGSRAGYRAPPSPVPREKTTARRRHGLQGDSCALLWASWEHDDVDAANAEFVEKCLAPPFAYRVAAFEMFESRAAEQTLSVRCGCCSTYRADGTTATVCVTRGRAVLTF